MLTHLPSPLGLASAPAAGERTVVERPPPGLGRGVHATSSGVVIGATLALLLFFVGYYATRLRRRKKS